MEAVTLGPEPYTSEAYIIMPDHDPQICEKDRPLTYENVNVQKLEAYYNDTYDFSTWSGGVTELNYNISVISGILRDYPYKPPRDEDTQDHEMNQINGKKYKKHKKHKKQNKNSGYKRAI